MKKSTLIIIVLIVAFFGGVAWLSAVNDEQPTQQQTTMTDAEKFKQEYPKVAADNRFTYTETEQVVEVFESGTGLVLLGFQECPWCQEIAPILDKAAKAENLDQVHYLDIKEARANNNAVYQQLVEQLEEYLRKDEDGNPRIYVPDIAAVRDGQIVGHFLQETAPAGEQLTPEEYWTEERSKRAVAQLREMIQEMRADQVD